MSFNNRQMASHASPLSSSWVMSSFDSDNEDNEDNDDDKCTNNNSINNRKRGLSCDKQLSNICKSSEKVLVINDDTEVRFIEKFAPKNRNDLAVSKRKIKELDSWFNQQFNNNDHSGVSPFLLLKGPSGAGKTCAVKILAKEYDVRLIECNVSDGFCSYGPSNVNCLKNGEMMGMSQLKRFTKFISDSNFCGNFVSETRDGVMSFSQRSSNGTGNDRSRKMIVIEEFPNAFLLSPSQFHTVLMNYKTHSVPIVFIISEFSNGQSNEYKLLPPDVQNRLKIHVINFKPITVASLNNVLTKICNNQLRKETIHSIIDCSGGDIRNAINTLEVKCSHLLKDSKCELYSSRSKTKRRKTDPIESKTDPIESNFDPGGRDHSVTFLHSIGKILYAKRGTETVSHDAPKYLFELPEHLHNANRLPLNESPERIVEKIMISCGALNSWLYQNYIDFVDSIDHAADCVQWLSESDSLAFGDWTCKPVYDSYQSLLSIRGLMYNLTNDTDHSSGDDPNKSQKRKNIFRPFDKPRMNEVNRSEYSLMMQCRRAASYMTHFTTFHAFVIDILPLISQIPHQWFKWDPNVRTVLRNYVGYGGRGIKHVTFERRQLSINEDNSKKDERVINNEDLNRNDTVEASEDFHNDRDCDYTIEEHSDED